MGDLTAAARRGRRALLGVAAFGAAAAVLAGLARLGVVLPVGAHHAADHGPLFVLGTFGTVIALERAVALGTRWGWLAPAASALTALALLARSAGVAAWIAVASGVALVAVNVAIVRRQTAAFTVVMATGSLALLVGSLAWALGRPIFEVVPAWMGFFVLTIVGERIEMSRLAPTPPRARAAIVALSAALAAVLAAALLARASTAYVRASGAIFAAMALWELAFDVARRTFRQRGLPRFAATGVLAGVCWLLCGGLLLARFGLPPAGALYDAAVHAVLVGFVLSMVMAHAPIILPAVARIAVPWHRVLYAPLVVLHAGLVARVAGDLLAWGELRRAGGIANAAALVLVPISVICARYLASREPRRGPYAGQRA